ncbi:MAG: hypothetical protein QNJ46_13765 [Leptolyngbyaceae cyanobacterium MO_188.B28]|nr:hypothetical protein [Leptolyngbyaceae cyanobacterium MO_188.B28]
MAQITVWILVAIALGFVVSVARWQTYVQSMPAGLEFEPAHPEDFSQLNQGQLDQYTEEIASLGFSPIADFKVTAELGKLSPCFFRLFRHPEEGCHAVVSQSFPEKGNSLSQKCWITSFLEQGWTLRTTNESPYALAPLIHLSHYILNFRPNATPADLFQFHVSQRMPIASALNLEVLHSLSTEDVLIKAKEQNWREKQIIKRQNVALSFVKAVWFSLRPQRDLLGDYPSAIAQRQKNSDQ